MTHSSFKSNRKSFTLLFSHRLIVNISIEKSLLQFLFQAMFRRQSNISHTSFSSAFWACFCKQHSYFASASVPNISMRTLSVRPQSYSTLPILIRPGRRESYEDGRGATQLVTQIRQCSSEPNPFSRDTFHKCSPDQKAILTFWFGSQFPNEIPEGQGERWFIGTPELNAEIIAKFKGLVQQAVEHKLDGW